LYGKPEGNFSQVQWEGLPPALQKLYPSDQSGMARVPSGISEVIAKNALPSGTSSTQLNPSQLVQRNALMTDLFKRLNPGKPMDPNYLLQPGATQEDDIRLEGTIKSLESMAATEAQRNLANTTNQQLLELRRSEAADREQQQKFQQQQQGFKSVIGLDANGRQVLVPASDSQRYGLSNVMDAPASDVSKAYAARDWIPMVTQMSSPDMNGQTQPDRMGIMQLVDELDRKGALGPLASRWNDFMTGTWGGGTGDAYTDALYSALRAKLGLSKTLLMNLHVGSRGGAYMMEHFEDLANEKHMNANVLRSGLKSELDYARERAMLPPQQTAQTPVFPTSRVHEYAAAHNMTDDQARKAIVAMGNVIQ